jgi:hypothetical protein
VANPVDNFSTVGVDYRSPSCEQLIFNRGARFLGEYGLGDHAARTFLGHCKKIAGVGRTMDALVVAIFSRPAGDPKAFILGVLAKQPQAIPGNWEPDPAAVNELEALSIPTALIRNARDIFVTWFSDMEIRHSDWPRLFREWVIRDWERAEFQIHEYRSRLAKSAGLTYGKPFHEPA